MNALLVIVGLAAGLLIGWLWATARASRSGQEERARLVAAETRLEEMTKQSEAQRALLQEARTQLSDTFRALSSDALQANSQMFVDRTRETLAPLQEALARYETHLREVEQTRQRDRGSLEEQLRQLAESEQQLQRETANLVTALRRPDVRGRWGEVTLHRVVELAGMLEHCDFDEQVSVEGDDGRLRPDMVIHLPAGRDIVVDSKAPLDAYLSAAEAQDPETRSQCLDRHCRHLRQHMASLATKSYWGQFATAPEFVVMFVPGESFLSAAASQDLTLIEEGMQKSVFPATPVTLIALLKTVAHGWRQEQLARNAQEISEVGRQLYDRLRAFLGHVQKLGRQLGSATGTYNDAVGSLERNVLPGARRFRDLGAATGAEAPELEPVDTQVRELVVPEAAGESDAE
jgi:DNA recombination protein RmuC